MDEGKTNYQKWRKVMGKIVSCMGRIDLLKTCKKVKFTPPTLKLKSNTKGIEKIIKKAEIEIVSKIIRDIYKQINNLRKEAVQYTKNDEQREKQWNEIAWKSLNHLKENLRIKRTKKWKGWIEKYKLKNIEKTLFGKNNITEIEMRDKNAWNNLVDRTTKGLTQKEFGLLNKGSQFCFKHNTIDKTTKQELILECEKALTKITTNKNEIRLKIWETIKNENKTQNETEKKKTLKDVKKSLKENGVIVVKADKGGKLVAIEQTKYTAKVEEHLQSEMYEKLEDYSSIEARKFERKVQRVIGEAKNIWTSTEYRYIRPAEKGRTAIATGRIKIHKENEVVRPVINTRESPTRQLAKWLAKIIKSLMRKEETSFTTTKDWVNSIKELRLDENDTIAVYDINAFYPEVDRKQAFEEGKKLLEERSINGYLHIENKQINTETLVKLLDMCLQDNIFKWSTNWYKQKTGLFIGSCISPCLAELCARKQEKEVLKVLQDKGIKPKKYGRYVDDMSVIGKKGDLEKFGDIWNQQKGLQIKLERMGQKVKYLDTIAEIKEDNGVRKIQTTWLYNQYGTGHVIDWKSGHNYSTKKGVFWGGLDRIKSACSENSGFDQGERELVELYKRSGYPITTLEWWRQEWVYRRKNNIVRNREEKPHIGNFPSTNQNYKIRNIFRDKGTTSFHYKNNLYSIFKERKITPKTQGVGVYTINCNECDKIYVGETNRALEVRLDDHKRDISNKKEINAIYKHKKETGHEMNWSSATIKTTEEDWYKRRIIESIEIERAKQKGIHLNGNKGLELANGVIEKLQETEKTYNNITTRKRRANI